MLKKSSYFILFLITTVFSSCFEIIEQVYLKKDGSGNFQLILNMSRSKTKLNSIIKMKTINGHEVPSRSEISRKIKEVEREVARTKGLTGVKTSINFDEYIVAISGNFANVSQINTAIKNADQGEHKAKEAKMKSIEFDLPTGMFSRLNKFSLREDYDKMSTADKEIFATASFTSIYRFESTVISVKNKLAKVSPSRQAVMLNINVLDIVTGKKSIENTIQLTHP